MLPGPGSSCGNGEGKEARLRVGGRARGKTGEGRAEGAPNSSCTDQRRSDQAGWEASWRKSPVSSFRCLDLKIVSASGCHGRRCKPSPGIAVGHIQPMPPSLEPHWELRSHRDVVLQALAKKKVQVEVWRTQWVKSCGRLTSRTPSACWGQQEGPLGPVQG